MPDVPHDPPQFEPLVVEQDSSDGGTGEPHRHRRAVIAGAVLAVAVAVAVVVVVASGDGSENESGGEADTTTTAPIDETSATPSSAPPATLPAVSAEYPMEWSVVDVGETAAGISSEVLDEGSVEWSIPVPEPLARMAQPSTVGASTLDGVLHRIEFPSGRITSQPLPADASGQIAVAGDSIAVPVPGAIVIVDADGSRIAWAADTDGVPRVVTAGPRFVVTAPSGVDGSEGQWLLEPNGSATDVTDDPFAPFAAWDPRFTPAGELLADDGDDEIVAVDPAGGARPIDRGRLAAAGSQHYVVRTCDVDPCDYTIVELSTGQRIPAALGVLDAYRFFDTSIRVSPDGRYVQYADWRRERPRNRIVDVADGFTIDAGELGDVRTPDAWAADSSGVFVAGDKGLVFRGVDGRVAVIDGLGPLDSVATLAGG